MSDATIAIRLDALRAAHAGAEARLRLIRHSAKLDADARNEMDAQIGADTEAEIEMLDEQILETEMLRPAQLPAQLDASASVLSRGFQLLNALAENQAERAALEAEFAALGLENLR